MTTDDPAGVLTRPAPEPDRSLRYGDHPDQVIDLRLPPASSGVHRPVVVVVHGGFWRARYDRRHAGPQAAALAGLGYVVAVPEYRRVGQEGGGWPGTFEDTAMWCTAIPGLVRDEIGDLADLDRIVLVGHSAGGHLALWAASRQPPMRVRGVVSLAGVCDLALAATLRLGDGATQDLMGGEPAEVPERYARADPAAMLPIGVPVTLVHGEADGNVPLHVSRRYAERARSDDVRLVELTAVGHFELIDPLSTAWPAVVEAIRHLVD